MDRKIPISNFQATIPWSENTFSTYIGITKLDIIWYSYSVYAEGSTRKFLKQLFSKIPLMSMLKNWNICVVVP